MDGRKEGLTAALEALGAGELPGAGAAGEQDDLFEPAGAPMPMPPARGVSGPKGGRPRGARNKRTDEWVEYLLGRYRSPLVFLLETYSRTPRQLAAELELYKWHEGELVLQPKRDANGALEHGPDGKLLFEPVLATGDAAEIQVRAAIAALPYLHQRLPLAIETKGEQRGVLLIGELSAALGEAGDGLAQPLAPVEQNQRVIEGSIEKSDGEKSDDRAGSQ